MVLGSVSKCIECGIRGIMVEEGFLPCGFSTPHERQWETRKRTNQSCQGNREAAVKIQSNALRVLLSGKTKAKKEEYLFDHGCYG